MSTWLNKKEREIKILNATLQNLAEVEFLSNPGDLDTYIYGGEFKTIICFEYNVIQIQDSHLEAMNLYLSSGSVNENKQSYRCWYEDRTLMNKLQASIKQFKEFALKNKERKGVKFVALDCTPDNPDDPQVPTIVLYENGTSSPFIPPGKPEKPSCVNVTSSSITIRWIPPKDGAENIDSHIVYYKLVTTDIWSTGESNTPNTTVKICDLDAGDYEFKICPVCKAGLGLESDISDPIPTKPEEISLAEEVLKECQRHKKSKIENGPPVVYQLPLHCLLKQKVNDPSLNLRHGEELMIAKYEVGKPVLSPKTIQEKVIMVVGATGAGKTTLINGFVNYLYGVKRDHKFRFKVIADEGNKSKTESQTTDITVYTFYPRKGSPVSYTLTLIDTPGFGDCKERGKAIIKQVEHFYRIGPPYGVNILHGIGFVTKACDERLTITQKYVFQSILAIYGKDIEGNIF